MIKAVWTGAVAAAAILLLSSPVSAQQTDTKTVSVNATVNARAKLTLGSAAITFADADPDVTPTLTATAFSVDVKARTTAAGTVSLTVSAPNFTSGSDSIPIGNLQWTATGTAFATPGTMSTSAISAGSWTGSGNQAGTHTYTLANSWAYNTGSYGTTITYTLTAP